VNPRSWSVPIHVLALLAVALVGYGLEAWTSGVWETMVQLAGGLLIMVLGVTLAYRLQTRDRDE
jgi:hypothetical protein